MSVFRDKALQLKQDLDDVYSAGYEKGKSEGGGDEILFTSHGNMYKRNMIIDIDAGDGFYAYAYRYAKEMETLSVPNLIANYTATNGVFEGCSKLKSVYMPNIQRLGLNFFNDCPLLEEITLGTTSNPMQHASINSFYRCPSLVNFNYIGVLPVTITFEHSVKLNATSIKTIINSLSGSATGQTLTLSLAAVNKAFETSEGANDGSTTSTWNYLANVKQNWTITLQ